MDIRDLDRLEPAVLQEMVEELPPSRQAYAGRYHRREDRLRSIGAGLLMEYGLQKQGLVSVDAESEQIRRSPDGKPYIQREGVSFNVSHSGHYVVGVFGKESCGIDIQEYVQQIAYLPSFFSAEEWEWIQHNPAVRATRLWTIKESYGKWIGSGIAGELPDMRDYLTDEYLSKQVVIQGRKVYIREYQWMGDYALTVCSPEKPPESFQKVFQT